MARKAAAPEAHPEAGILYRVDGGEPVRAEDMNWGEVGPWNLVERKSAGSPWLPTIPEPPVFLAETNTRKSPDGSRYQLTEAVWPPKHYRRTR